jgi:hypothetical protein
MKVLQGWLAAEHEQERIDGTAEESDRAPLETYAIVFGDHPTVRQGCRISSEQSWRRSVSLVFLGDSVTGGSEPPRILQKARGSDPKDSTGNVSNVGDSASLNCCHRPDVE